MNNDEKKNFFSLLQRSGTRPAPTTQAITHINFGIVETFLNMSILISVFKQLSFLASGRIVDFIFNLNLGQKFSF